MYTLQIEHLKSLDAEGLRTIMDKALSAMLYPMDDPTHTPGNFLTLEIKKGDEFVGGNIVALRYIWMLYKRATIPGYVAGHSPEWYEPPNSQAL